MAFNSGSATATLQGAYSLAFGGTGDSSGSPGDATLNTTSGTSAFGASSTCTITNSNVTATTKVFAQLMDVDGTKYICAVTPTSNAFTVTASAAMTSGKKFYWYIIK